MYCCSNMYRSCAFIKRLSFYRVLFQIACFFIPIYSLAADNYSRIIGKRVVMPSSYVDTADYIFIHIVRGQECTECSINALYQWDYIIAGTSPMSHNLINIAQSCGLNALMSEEQKLFISEIMPLNIESRYPSYKQALAEGLSEGKCRKLIDNTKSLQQWIKDRL